MYNRPYKINSVVELVVVVMLADYYCSCPILSATLTAELVGSPLFTPGEYSRCNDLAIFAASTLIMARKLQHALLFQECFIHVVGRWDIGEEVVGDQLIEADPVLFGLVASAHNALALSLLKASQALMGHSACFEVAREHRDLALNEHPMASADYHRALLEKVRVSTRVFPTVYTKVCLRACHEEQFGVGSEWLWRWPRTVREVFPECEHQRRGFTLGCGRDRLVTLNF